VLDTARKAQHREVLLDIMPVNQGSISFHRRLGFEPLVHVFDLALNTTPTGPPMFGDGLQISMATAEDKEYIMSSLVDIFLEEENQDRLDPELPDEHKAFQSVLQTGGLWILRNTTQDNSAFMH